MAGMVPIEAWWLALDTATRSVIAAEPILPLTSDLAARIHEAGGVLDAEGFFSSEGSPGYRIPPDDIERIRAHHTG